jgi:hypothetical protein
MTPNSRYELLKAVRPRYQKATRAEKTRILDEFVASTGYHRKYAIRLLKHGKVEVASHRRRGRRPVYNKPEVIHALTFIWETCDRICSRRLHPHLREMVAVLERHEELSLSAEAKELLLSMSRATIDRLLAAKRRQPHRRGLSLTKPGTLLKRAIPVRAGTEWDEQQPGYVEVDLVAHSGDSAAGEFIHTLDVVDVHTSWTVCRAVPNRGQAAVFDALLTVRRMLPFPLRGLDSDNGSEFINHHLYRYCQEQGILFTRSRPYRKNDQAHVEQKNWSVVRRQVGYDRYESPQALEALNELYHLLHDYVNFFLPVQKILSKTRVDGRVRKEYDTAQTPYQRALDAPSVSEDAKRRLRETYLTLNPVALRRQIDQQLEVVWSLAVE